MAGREAFWLNVARTGTDNPSSNNSQSYSSLRKLFKGDHVNAVFRFSYLILYHLSANIDLNEANELKKPFQLALTSMKSFLWMDECRAAGND